MSIANFAAVDRGIPRRLSTRKSDRHFDAEVVARLSDSVAVMLDGVELPEVAAWDVDAGTIIRRCRRKDGSFMLDKDGALTFETLKGEVEVRWSKDSVA